jgi:2-(1,2-epoxy-1,2-dihydrophenyl)acetyl-CoA isomerase
VKVGLIPDGGGTWSLRRLIGPARAKEMTFTGETIGAEKALEWGLVNRVFQIETFDEEVLNFASMISRQSPDSLSLGKKAINEASTGTFEEALEREAKYQKQIFEGKWGFEGFQAFLEKRRPKWMDE